MRRGATGSQKKGVRGATAAARFDSGERSGIEMTAISDLHVLLSHLQPVLNPGRYAFVTAPRDEDIDPALVVASIREPEGLSLIVAEETARALGWPIALTAAWITLTVHSDLAAVGLTAAFAGSLGRAGISCNVVAGVHHDHLFVPSELAEQAMDTLRTLQQSAA